MHQNASFLINQREYTVIQPLRQELDFTHSGSYLFDLDYLNLVEVHGKQSREFLQGQLSCDVRMVDVSHLRQGVLCNLQGRIRAALTLFQWNELCLLLPVDLTERVLCGLKKPAALSKVLLTPASHSRILGFWHDASESNPIPFDWVLPQHAFETSIYPEGIILSLGHQLYLFVVTSPEAERLLATWRELHALKGSLAWHATCLSQGLFEIYPNTAELFLPHHVNMHLTGQLSFNKGCYKGQEIIARMHYRASIKHTLKVFNLNRNLSIESGMKLMSLDNKRELGVIIDYCPLSTTGDYLITTSFVIEHFNKVLINGETVTLSLSGNTDMNVK